MARTDAVWFLSAPATCFTAALSLVASPNAVNALTVKAGQLDLGSFAVRERGGNPLAMKLIGRHEVIQRC